jgi:hypothetical protein
VVGADDRMTDPGQETFSKCRGCVAAHDMMGERRGCVEKKKRGKRRAAKRT